MTLLIAFLTCAAVPAHAKIVEKIVAVVNNEVITQSEVDSILYPLYTKYSETCKSESELYEKLDQERIDVLKQLVNDRLILGEAKKLNISVADKEVEERIDMVKKDLESRGMAFNKMLKQENLTMGDLRKRFREQIMIERTIDREVKDGINIQPSEISNYYKEHIGDYTQPQQVAVCTILIKKESVRKPEESRKLAYDIRDIILSGSDFRETAKNYTEGPNREAGGDLGYMTRGQLMKEIDDVIFSLAKGEISRVIESPIGYHICMVYDKKQEMVIPFEEVRDKVYLALYRAKAQKKFEAWLDRLKSNAYIAIK